MNPEELAYWYWLTDIKGIGPIISKKLLDEFGSPSLVFSTSKSEIALRTGIRNSLTESIEHSRNNIGRYTRLAETQLKMAILVNGRILTSVDSPYSEVYTSHNGDKALPPIIHVIGDLGCLQSRAFAVVGTRRPSDEGKKRAHELAHSLATDGLTIVSGLALGIDGMAHKGALDVGGKTIAVLGCGADIKYPPENAHLYDSIAKQGLIVSEFPFGTRPTSENLRQRNRTIVSLSEAIVVAQCPLRSGAMIAARFAAQQRKPILTFRYEPTIDNSGGEWLMNKRLASELREPTASTFLLTLGSYQVTETGIDKIFSEIWKKGLKKGKSKSSKPVAKQETKKTQTASGVKAADRSETHPSESMQSTMVLGNSIDQQSTTGQMKKAFALKQGDRVKHPAFGEGKVVSITKNGDDYQITVRFAEKKTRALSWQYANLVKL